MSRPILTEFDIMDSDEPLAERVPAQAWAALTDSEIARRAGVTRERVRQVRESLGLPPSLNHRRIKGNWHGVLSRLTDEDWEANSASKVAEQLGISERYVARWRMTQGKPASIGSPLHDVTDEEWRTVPRRELAERYGLTPKAVNNFMRLNDKPRLARGKGSRLQYREEELDASED